MAYSFQISIFFILHVELWIFVNSGLYVVVLSAFLGKELLTVTLHYLFKVVLFKLFILIDTKTKCLFQIFIPIIKKKFFLFL